VIAADTAFRANARAFRTATSLPWRSLVEDARVELLKSGGFGDDLVPSIVSPSMSNVMTNRSLPRGATTIPTALFTD
jgi:hypothetical protein